MLFIKLNLNLVLYMKLMKTLNRHGSIVRCLSWHSLLFEQIHLNIQPLQCKIPNETNQLNKCFPYPMGWRGGKEIKHTLN